MPCLVIFPIQQSLSAQCIIPILRAYAQPAAYFSEIFASKFSFAFFRQTYMGKKQQPLMRPLGQIFYDLLRNRFQRICIFYSHQHGSIKEPIRILQKYFLDFFSFSGKPQIVSDTIRKCPGLFKCQLLQVYFLYIPARNPK